MNHQLLGGLSAGGFLRRHWQKKPLFAAAALPECGHWLTRALIFELAARDDLESRLVLRTRQHWEVREGPFKLAALRRLPARGWSLLVHGVETVLHEARAVLDAFSFIPHARLDDLMVSYAPAGGGVGPHFDSYDVFLLQGMGTRRWRVSAQSNLTLVDEAPLRILRHFQPQQEWTTRQGDLLYLPPGCAHEGVSLDEAVTLSVGFRAPRRQELASHYLEYLQDTLELDGIYEDPDLTVPAHPGELPPAMLARFTRMLAGVAQGSRGGRGSRDDVRQFAGRYLTEPKVHVIFAPPPRPLAPAAFARRVARDGLSLAPASRLLMSGGTAFINGEAHAGGGHRALLLRLADRRVLAPCVLPAAVARLLHGWHCAGYVVCGDGSNGGNGSDG